MRSDVIPITVLGAAVGVFLNVLNSFNYLWLIPVLAILFFLASTIDKFSHR